MLAVPANGLSRALVTGDLGFPPWRGHPFRPRSPPGSRPRLARAAPSGEMLATADAGRHACSWPIPARARRWPAPPTPGRFRALAARWRRGTRGGLHTLYVRRSKRWPMTSSATSSRRSRRSASPSRRDTQRRHAVGPQGSASARAATRAAHARPNRSRCCSYPEAAQLFAGLRRVVIDEVHAFADRASGATCSLSPGAPAGDRAGHAPGGAFGHGGRPRGFRAWLAPWGEIDAVDLVEGEPGAPPEVEILLPEEPTVPWAGHAATWAIPQLYTDPAQPHDADLHQHALSCRMIFQLLWDVNEANLPIGIHHGSLIEGSAAQGRRRDGSRRAAGAGLHGEPRPRRRLGRHRLRGPDGCAERLCACCSGSGGPTTGSTSPAGATRSRQPLRIPRGDRGQEAVDEGQRDGEDFRPGGLDVLAQHVMACACAAPFHEAGCSRSPLQPAPYAWLDEAGWQRVLTFVATGGYALRAYDKLQAHRARRNGTWRLTHPEHAARHRLNAGIIVDAEMIEVRFRNGRALGKVGGGVRRELPPAIPFALPART